MSVSVLAVATLAALALVAPASTAAAAGPNTSFSFNARDITGTSGAVTLTGGGAFSTFSTRPAHSGGSFSCTAPVGGSGLLAGCQTGDGVRWDSDTLLPSTNFKCLANEVPKPVSTSDDTVVLHADFYRAGDGINESFQANMAVSAHDIDNVVPGIQNVWVQGVGCAMAMTHFGR
jgi:hypothetical protein